MARRVCWILALVTAAVILPFGGATAAEPRGWGIAVPGQPAESRRTSGPMMSDIVVDAHGVPGQLVTVELRLTFQRASIDLSFTPRAVRTDHGVPQVAAPRLDEAASWIHVPRTRAANVPPGTAPLPLRISIPRTATVGERLAWVTIERRGTDERVDVLVRLRVDGPMRAALVLKDSSLTYRPARAWLLSRGQAQWSLTATNDGTTILRGRFEARIGTLFGRHVVAATRPNVVLAPGDSISLSRTLLLWPSVLLRPEVAIEHTVTSSDDSPRAAWAVGDAAEPLVVVPWAALIWMLGVGIAALTLWIVTHRHRSLHDVVELP